MSVGAASAVKFYADVVSSGEGRLSRFWHTAATITVAASAQSVVILPLEGTLRLTAQGSGPLGEIERGSFAVIGPDSPYSLEATAPTSWMEIRTAGGFGGDLVGARGAQLLRDPEQLQAPTVEVVNAILSSSLQPDSVALDLFGQAVESLLVGAIMSARAAAA